MSELYSLDKFIETAKTMPKYHQVSRVAFAGFRQAMFDKDMQYTFNPQDYVRELDRYLND